MMFERRAAMATLLADRPKNLFVVPGLGSCTWDAFAAGDDDRNFYLWGAMGGAAMIGLGLALAKPNARVAVITGDGEMLMGLGSLATIGVQKPEQPRHRGVRQRPLRRDRHAGEPHQRRRRSAGGRARLRHRARDGRRGRGGLEGTGRAARDLAMRRCSRACGSRRTIRRACCRRRTACVIKDRVRRAALGVA